MNFGLIIYASFRTFVPNFEGPENGFGSKNCQNASQGKPCCMSGHLLCLFGTRTFLFC